MASYKALPHQYVVYLSVLLLESIGFSLSPRQKDLRLCVKGDMLYSNHRLPYSASEQRRYCWRQPGRAWDVVMLYLTRVDANGINYFLMECLSRHLQRGATSCWHRSLIALAATKTHDRGCERRRRSCIRTICCICFSILVRYGIVQHLLTEFALTRALICKSLVLRVAAASILESAGRFLQRGHCRASFVADHFRIWQEPWP